MHNSKELPLFNDFDGIRGKRVIVRVDFNVPVEDGGRTITDDYRLTKTAPFLKHLFDAGARIVLLSHLTEKKTHRSFKLLLDVLCQHIGIPLQFASSVEEARHSRADAVLVENLRVFAGEEENDPVFAKSLASLGDIFINEGFSQSHRPYASVVGLPLLLPSFVGPLFHQEVVKLREVFEPEHPFMFILGGVKFSTKVAVLDHFMASADVVFVGGALVNTFLMAQGAEVGVSPVEKDAITHIQNMFLSRGNLLLPKDVLVEHNAARRVGEIQTQDFIYDAGPETMRMLTEKIQDMRMILWNGPLGFVEKGYHKGTTDLMYALADCSAKVIVGGGDTIGFIRKQNMEKDFYYLSTGGGAMLEFLAKGTLPGIDAILKNQP